MASRRRSRAASTPCWRWQTGGRKRRRRRHERVVRSEAVVSPFVLRGLKGLWWEPEQYLGWPAFLAEAGYDLFMLCYTFCPETGLRWRQPFQAAELEVIGRLAEECRA